VLLILALRLEFETLLFNGLSFSDLCKYV